MEPWVETEQYQQVMDACRCNDKVTVHRIIEECLTTAKGPERSFWLRIRAAQRARDGTLPHLLEVAWADLEEARRLAPGDREVRLMTLSEAFGLAVRVEWVDRLPAILKAIRREYGQFRANPFMWQDLGLLNMKRGRWHRAARAFDHAIGAYGMLTETEKKTFACRLAHYHAWRAVCRVACGDEALASADVSEALSLAVAQPEQSINHSVLGMARAEIALQERLLQEARTFLQHGVMRDSLLKRPKAPPAQVAETDLLAARIARAEGNLVGFEHFCKKALDTCRQYRLPLTEARIHAVMAGAER